jgi:hypothetical protein
LANVADNFSEALFIMEFSGMLEKFEAQQQLRQSLSAQAINRMTAGGSPSYSTVVFPSNNIGFTNIGKMEFTKSNNEDNNMVTSTIIETHSASNPAAAAAVEMARTDNHERTAIKDASVSKPAAAPQNAKRRGRDLGSGMELLELDFILDVVENTTGSEDAEITMRQLCFKELHRRESMHEVGSAALKVYATNGKTYGKDIQCEAMKELALRTTHNCK